MYQNSFIKKKYVTNFHEMSFSDELKEKISHFDQETSQLLRHIIDRQRHEIDLFERNWIYKYQDLYKNYFSDEAIMAVRDIDERNELESQRTQLENSFKFQLKSLKRKHKIEYNNFTQKRLKDRALIFSTDKNTTILSYRFNSPLPSPIKISINERPNSNSNIIQQEKKEKKKRKVRKSHKHHKVDNKIDNILPDNSITDMNDTINSMSLSQISNHTQYLSKSQTMQPDQDQSKRSYSKSIPKSSFLSSRSKFITNQSINGHFTTSKPKFKQKNATKEEIDVLDIKSLDKHFKKRDQIRKEIEKARQTRFEENFSYQVNSKDVLNYKRKNITDKGVIERIQNKRKSHNECFDVIEIESPEIESNSIYKNIGNSNFDSKKIEEEEIKIAPVNKLDSIKLISESSSDSFDEKIPINQISLEYSYESYYSEYEVEEKVYLSPIKKIKKKSIK